MRNYPNRLKRGFTRQGPDYRFDDQVDFSDIRTTFGFRSMVVGKWVTKEERFISANLIYDALADLAQILHLPPKAIGLRGKLNFAFGHGGQKGVQAHYNTADQTLALAKNAGGGALAHEWFHAFDHHISEHLFVAKARFRFASKLWLSNTPNLSHPLNNALNDFYKNVFLDLDGENANEFVQTCIKHDQAHNINYMSMPEELAARCFEACIDAHSTIQNSFLVSGLKSSNLIYPSDQHVNKANKALNHYFELLGYALHKIDE
ncbi:CLCA_X family protein [Pseudoalteromonas espejiana]